jgi:hypothetical protein
MGGPRVVTNQALPADDRPYDFTRVDTTDLPDTPTRDRNIAASAWQQAPARLLELGADLGVEESAYKRRLHGWLLWRAGPAKGPARYLAIDHTKLGRHVEFELFGDKSGLGAGPSGVVHSRFRAWKEDLRDHPTV